MRAGAGGPPVALLRSGLGIWIQDRGEKIARIRRHPADKHEQGVRGRARERCGRGMGAEGMRSAAYATYARLGGGPSRTSAWRTPGRAHSAGFERSARARGWRREGGYEGAIAPRLGAPTMRERQVEASMRIRPGIGYELWYRSTVRRLGVCLCAAMAYDSVLQEFEDMQCTATQSDLHSLPGRPVTVYYMKASLSM
ncbi:hypothetical protein C8J57DRAFT_1238110 [Mycena rebaudengoi]|nr:hypothetical protein C8J57DRAFT_1238110 [Mycena rebaudengoi]